ncbi:Transposase IS66 family protein [Legionella santicrucis]|uniref:Transposase IS66 family protein n=1 Tax=Legionella santicrucis TaxID=45074 RepID=A0A0W0Z211_9GAMM|nr:IS66 family transposase [Legionella santicrucis]KTD63143.1 Transposase IS66 family protein [Legionella santicrucis]
MKKTDSLPQSISELQALVLALQEENATLKQNYERVLEQFRLAQQQRFSRSSESNVLQMELQFDEAEAVPAAELPEEENTVTITYTRNKPKRRTLPDNLPREVIEHDIAELDKQCTCGCLKHRIGEEVTEQLEIIPAQLKVIAHVRPNMPVIVTTKESVSPLCPCCFFPKVWQPPVWWRIPLLANTKIICLSIVRRKYGKEWGFTFQETPACGWVIHAADVCMPMREALISALLESNYLQADETPLQVMNEPGRNNTSNSYMWVYQSAKPDKKVILFDYRETRQALWPKEILNGYQGYLQTDGYSGYDWVNQHPDIIHLGCMAHARRPFAELVKLAKTTGKSHQAVAFFQKLYAIEKQAKVEKLSPEQRHQLRLSKALPILDEMKQWLEHSIRHAVPQSKLGGALSYMQQRWKELNHYLLDGIFEIDNNAIENQIRPFALGRKNWLFAATPNGAHASALFYSLIATANANGCNPFDYLRVLFENIRDCKSQQDFSKLLPFNLKQMPT